MPFNKSTRSYMFRALVAEFDNRTRAAGTPMTLTWREARLFFRAATAGAIYRSRHGH
jgi:hypothetical protein